MTDSSGGLLQGKKQEDGEANKSPQTSNDDRSTSSNDQLPPNQSTVHANPPALSAPPPECTRIPFVPVIKRSLSQWHPKTCSCTRSLRRGKHLHRGEQGRTRQAWNRHGPHTLIPRRGTRVTWWAKLKRPCLSPSRTEVKPSNDNDWREGRARGFF